MKIECRSPTKREQNRVYYYLAIQKPDTMGTEKGEAAEFSGSLSFLSLD